MVRSRGCSEPAPRVLECQLFRRVACDRNGGAVVGHRDHAGHPRSTVVAASSR